MAQLRLDYEKFVEKETVILVVGPDSLEDFKAYWREHDLPFIGLPDPGHTVLKKYGQEIKIFRFGRMPAQMIIDREGMLRFVYYGDSMSDIPTDDDMLDLLDELQKEESGTN
jgi:peroxiredoxin